MGLGASWVVKGFGGYVWDLSMSRPQPTVSQILEAMSCGHAWGFGIAGVSLAATRFRALGWLRILRGLKSSAWMAFRIFGQSWG